MRTLEIVLAAALVSGCGHASLIGQEGISAPDGCLAKESCGGSGTADAALSIGIATAMVGILGIALYHRLSSGS